MAGDVPLTVEAGVSLREVLRSLVETARGLTGARYGALGLLQPDRSQVAEFISSGIPDAEAKQIGAPPSGRGLLGAVIREARSIRVADLPADPRSCGVPPGHPAMTSFLGVPLRAGEETLGNLYLADKEGAVPFTAEDQRLVETLAAHAALAVGYFRQAAMLEEKRHLVEVLLEQAPVGIMLFDAPQGNIVFANEALRQILGRPIGPTAPGDPRPGLAVLQHPDGRPITLEDLPSWRALQGEVVARAEFGTVRPDGTRASLAVNAAPLRRGDAISGTVVTVQDISHRKELERLRDEFAMLIAHDLRGPASVMGMWAEVFIARVEGGAASIPLSDLERLRRNADHLVRMIDDLLDASRVDVGRLELRPEVVAVPEAVARLIGVLAPALGDRRVETAVVGPPPAVLVDPARFDQVLTNLLTNAGKYSAAGSPILVTVQAEDGGVLLSVADEGVGIAAEDLPWLFDRFYRAKGVRPRAGLGLGLYIARRLVEAQGGRISVESTPGRGSTFRVWLPPAPR